MSFLVILSKKSISRPILTLHNLYLNIARLLPPTDARQKEVKSMVEEEEGEDVEEEEEEEEEEW